MSLLAQYLGTLRVIGTRFRCNELQREDVMLLPKKRYQLRQT